MILAMSPSPKWRNAQLMPALSAFFLAVLPPMEIFDRRWERARGGVSPFGPKPEVVYVRGQNLG
jgi:hypothetical protein